MTGTLEKRVISIEKKMDNLVLGMENLTSEVKNITLEMRDGFKRVDQKIEDLSKFLKIKLGL